MSKSVFAEMREAEIERLKNDESLKRLKPEMIDLMEIEDDRVCYFLPKIGDECKQILSIWRNGKIKLVHFYYSSDFLGSDDEHRDRSFEEWSVEPEVVSDIFR